MTRVLLATLILTALPLGSRAEETVIRLNVQAMPAPKPALRYQLLPALRELEPGNPIQGYTRCFAEQQHFFFDKEAVGRRERMMAMPLPELAAQDLQDYGGSALRQADWAARLDNPDWQILLKLKTDGIGLLIPDVQQLRMLASALQVRFRTEVASHRFDDALRTAKTMFALARHMGEHPTLIADLVGFAIASVAIRSLEEMLEQPGCPNLFWALTTLPNPLVPMEKGMESERVWTQVEFPGLAHSAPLSKDQFRKLIAHIDKVLESKPGKSVREYLNARTKDAELVRAARRRLVEAGHPEERLLGFSADQLILFDEWREYEVRRDEVMKLMNLPDWQIEALGGEKLERWDGLFAGIMTSFVKIRRAQGRLEQRIALLRHVEALRLYAADHGGRLPVTLVEVAVPLPVDPFTGKPFRYHLDGATAHIRGTPPESMKKSPIANVHYEVTIQK